MPSSLSEQTSAAAAKVAKDRSEVKADEKVNEEEQGQEEEDEDDDEDENFARLELEVAETMNELSENALLGDFAEEYEKLSRAFKSAHENEIIIRLKW